MLTNKLTIITIMSLIQLSLQEFLVDSEEAQKKRYIWNRNNTDIITTSKIDLAYTEEQGTYCLAKKNIFEKEFVFRIPKNYIICGCKLFLLKKF